LLICTNICLTDGSLYTNDEDTWHKIDDSDNTIKLKKLSTLTVSFVRVVAGYAHWLALVENGELYSWGSNRSVYTIIELSLASCYNVHLDLANWDMVIRRIDVNPV
jgi:alpha-tubulin suppressor-like RCC1 family protein